VYLHTPVTYYLGRRHLRGARKPAVLVDRATWAASIPRPPAGPCEFLAALDRGDYLPCSQCPCRSCRFSCAVTDLSQRYLDACQ
jgi:hypothetical protein